MGHNPHSTAQGQPQDHPDLRDPWRIHMRRSAERLRLLDEGRFKSQIARIDECLRTDAAWNLEAALRCCDRWYGPARAC